MPCLDSQKLNFAHELFLEIERADKKHGDWSGKTIDECFTHIDDELKEVAGAIQTSDFHSEHGLIRESIQVAATAFKIWRRAHEISNQPV